MALPLPPGLTPPETAFLCEMELVTVVPRQRLEGLQLLGVSIPWPSIISMYITHKSTAKRLMTPPCRVLLNPSIPQHARLSLSGWPSS